MEYNKLLTGHEYKLKDLFAKDNRIIIPDLQRDYCWGTTVNQESRNLVEAFIDNLLKSDCLKMGLLYGYEAPLGHIQLCDGQQRITTLFLLLGMLNKKTENDSFKRLIISETEENDDWEPYLQYSIRESSLYFLSDLTRFFFIKDKELHVEDIRKQSWYFKDYDLDPSIQNMIAAMSIIETKLTDDIDYEEVGNKISNFSFIYYDMGGRSQGEETFVVINTTGEPLSPTQNMKPLVIYNSINGGDKELSNHWEEIETWFWKKRQNNNDTADAGFNEFLRWVTILYAEKKEQRRVLSEGKYTFPVSEIPFAEIYSCWKIVKFLFDDWELKLSLDINFLSPSENNKTISQIDCFQLLPLIAYCKKWTIPQSEIEKRNFLRFYFFVQNLSHIANVKSNVNELVFDIIKIAQICKDVLDLINDEAFSSSISKTIFSEEEKLKLQIIKDNLSIRKEIEEEFWHAQSLEDVPSHEIWSGQIYPLIYWSLVEGKFDFDKFQQYSKLFDKTFTGKCDANIDIVRRALLTKNLKEYPKKFKGNNNYSFGWEWCDWKILINENLDKFKSFFDDIITGKTMQQMIDEFDPDKDWAEFVKKDYLLEYCEQKNIRMDNLLGWLLIQRERKTSYFSVNNYHLEKYLNSNFKNEKWKIGRWRDNTLVVENEYDDIVFCIWYQCKQWYIQLFKRYNESETEDSLREYIDDNWEINGKGYETSINFESVNQYEYPNVIELLRGIIENMK